MFPDLPIITQTQSISKLSGCSLEKISLHSAPLPTISFDGRTHHFPVLEASHMFPCIDPVCTERLPAPCCVPFVHPSKPEFLSPCMTPLTISPLRKPRTASVPGVRSSAESMPSSIPKSRSEWLVENRHHFSLTCLVQVSGAASLRTLIPSLCSLLESWLS